MAVTGDTAGLVAELVVRLEALSERVGVDVVVSSGRRNGHASASAHNSGIAADVKIAGMKTVEIADQLVSSGFAAVGEYYDTSGNEFLFAHGDIRGLPGSESSGAYAPGGSKTSTTCWWRVGTATGGQMHIGARRSGHRCPS